MLLYALISTNITTSLTKYLRATLTGIIRTERSENAFRDGVHLY